MVEWLGYAMHLFPPVILIKNEDGKKKKRMRMDHHKGLIKCGPGHS